MDKFYNIFTFSSISTLLPFLASMFFFKRLKKMDGVALLRTFFFVAALTDMVLLILSLQHKQSAWISHLYTVIEYALIAAILSKWQIRGANAKLIRTSIPIFVALFVIIKTAGIENFAPDTINFITRPLAVFLLGASVFLTLYALWSRAPESLLKDDRFWMLVAMALYYSSSIILFAFMYTKNTSLLVFLLKVHAVVNILHNVLFTIGVIFCSKRARARKFEAKTAGS